jgi:hypothetical protein
MDYNNSVDLFFFLRGLLIWFVFLQSVVDFWAEERHDLTTFSEYLWLLSREELTQKCRDDRRLIMVTQMRDGGRAWLGLQYRNGKLWKIWDVFSRQTNKSAQGLVCGMREIRLTQRWCPLVWIRHLREIVSFTMRSRFVLFGSCIQYDLKYL